MGGARERIREHGLIAVVDNPEKKQLFRWAVQASAGGIQLLGIPVWLPDVTEIASDLADEAGISVGVTDVVSAEQVSVALAAGADFLLSPVAEPSVLRTARDRGIVTIVGGATPTEVARAAAAGADFVTVFPVGVLGGPAYFEVLARQFKNVELLASGQVDVENAPAYLEAGATAAIVDRGVFPEADEPAALEIIRARAKALTEVCSHARNGE